MSRAKQMWTPVAILRRIEPRKPALTAKRATWRGRPFVLLLRIRQTLRWRDEEDYIREPDDDCVVIPSAVVIPSEARDLLFARSKSRSLAMLGMTSGDSV